MGGHALKKVDCVRKPADTYNRIKEHVLSVLASADVVCAVPLEVPGKVSYGDLDVLYVPKPGLSSMVEFVRNHFGPTEIAVSGPVMSFDCTTGSEEFRNFQIDFISTPEADLEMAMFYLSYSDVGGLLGRVVNARGLKLGTAGLWIDVNLSKIDGILGHTAGVSDIDLTLTTERLILTNEPQMACDFLGLNWKTYQEGFLSEKEIFAWICSCKLFDASIFLSLNYPHRQRASQRPFYQQFLSYINVCASEIQPACNKRGEVLANLQPEAVRHFQKQEELLAMKQRARVKQARSQKFNAGLFMVHKLAGHQLGRAIEGFKKRHVGDNLDRYIDSHSAEEIESQVDGYCEEFVTAKGLA